MRTLDATEKRVNDQYLAEPWGQLLVRYGFLPYDTESSARRVAESATKDIQLLFEHIRALGEQPKCACVNHPVYGDAIVCARCLIIQAAVKLEKEMFPTQS